MQYANIALMESKPEIRELMAVAVTTDKRFAKYATAALTGQSCNMEIGDIQIYPCYEEHPPKPEKMEHKAQYFEQTGRFQSEIILDKDGYLIDGYTSYLLAREQGMKRVLIRYGKRQIIKAYHWEGGKLYEWELPQSMIDRVSAGDKVLVPTKHGPKVVTVSAVEPYRPQEYIQKLRTAIKVKKGVLHNGMV